MASSGKTTSTAAANPAPQKKGKGATVSKAEKDRLFNLYIVPHFVSIKALTVKYTDKYQDVDDNYNYVLEQMWSYIYSYNPSQKLDTWIHIVTKRACFKQNQARAKRNAYKADMEYCTSDQLHQHGTANMVDAGFGTLADNLSDEIYSVLLQIPPKRLSPFLLEAQGLGIREITQLEYKAGHLDKKSEDVVKSRIFWAKKQLQYLLRQNGISKASYTSERRTEQSD